MLLTSCELNSLCMGFDLIELLLTFGSSGTSRGIPYIVQAPLFERLCPGQGIFVANWAGSPEVRDFFFVSHFIPFCIRMI